MYISRLVVRAFRNFGLLDVKIGPGVTCIVGANNTGKSNLIDAIRLAIDANMTSFRRQLSSEDFAVGTDYTIPAQVLVSIEFTGFTANPSEEAMVFGHHIKDDVARITYRFRPKREIREAIKAGVHPGHGLFLDDYRWEISGGGDIDPSKAEWQDDFGKSVRFDELQQSYLVVFMEALRDVGQRLRQSRASPLTRVLSSADVPEAEQDGLVKILANANDAISKSNTIKKVGTDISAAFAKAAGEAFKMGVKLGMAPPTFNDISRSLDVLLSNDVLNDITTERNGLGLNNLLYISMLLHYFQRRVAEGKTAGQLLIVEEPEAHLHPQLQRVLFGALRTEPFQTFLTTHSTHVTSAAELRSLVVLTNDGVAATSSCVPVETPTLQESEIADLERYLDATRGALLFARKVILVEGPAELFIIPRLVKSVMGLDLDELGISVVPIFGVHFAAYAKLFGPGAITKKCAIVADADLTPSDAATAAEFDEEISKPSLTGLENAYVKIFLGATTFEYELVDSTTLKMFELAAIELGASKAIAALRRLDEAILVDEPDALLYAEVLAVAKTTVLSLAKNVGKGRFAQVVSKHAAEATGLPGYIRDAVNWLRA